MSRHRRARSLHRRPDPGAAAIAAAIVGQLSPLQLLDAVSASRTTRRCSSTSSASSPSTRTWLTVVVFADRRRLPDPQRGTTRAGSRCSARVPSRVHGGHLHRLQPAAARHRRSRRGRRWPGRTRSCTWSARCCSCSTGSSRPAAAAWSGRRSGIIVAFPLVWAIYTLIRGPLAYNETARQAHLVPLSVPRPRAVARGVLCRSRSTSS